MYSKPFEKQRPFDENATTSDNWSEPKSTVLEQLSALNNEFGANQGKLVDMAENRPKSLENDRSVGLSCAVYHTFDDVEDIWRTFEKQAACFVYQQFGFSRTWYETVGKNDGLKPHLVVIKDVMGQVVMLVPLCTETGRFGTEVSFVGDGIADYLAPLVLATFANSLDQTKTDAVWAKILATFKTKVDLVWLDKQPASIVGVPNPLARLDCFDFAASAHALNYPKADNWSACARQIRSNKSVKKIEGRIRKLDRQGKVELVEITGTTERCEHMARLLELKIANLNDTGKLHRMDTPHVAATYQALVMAASAEKNIHQFELLCGDKTVASVLGFVHHDTFYYQICAFDREEFGQYSPGVLLLFKLFDWSFSRGIKRFDMTIGDEVYKGDWSNDSTPLSVVAIPYSTIGRLNYVRKRLTLTLKEFIKASPVLSKVTMRILNK